MDAGTGEETITGEDSVPGRDDAAGGEAIAVGASTTGLSAVAKAVHYVSKFTAR